MPRHALSSPATVTVMLSRAGTDDQRHLGRFSCKNATPWLDGRPSGLIIQEKEREAGNMAMAGGIILVR